MECMLQLNALFTANERMKDRVKVPIKSFFLHKIS
jgi:hypothetical protein